VSHKIGEKSFQPKPTTSHFKRKICPESFNHKQQKEAQNSKASEDPIKFLLKKCLSYDLKTCLAITPNGFGLGGVPNF